MGFSWRAPMAEAIPMYAGFHQAKARCFHRPAGNCDLLSYNEWLLTSSKSSAPGLFR